MQILDRLVCDVVIEVVVGVSDVGFDGLRAFVGVGSPLVGVATDEAIEVFEPETCRPEIERARLAGLPVRHVMVFTQPSCVPTQLAQYFGNTSGVLADQCVVPGVSSAT